MSETTAFLRLLGADIEEADEVRSREVAVRVLAPLQAHAVLGRREGDAGERVAVDDDVDSAVQRGLQLLHLLPAVGGEEQVDGVVVQFFVSLNIIERGRLFRENQLNLPSHHHLEIIVDDSADECRSVWEAHCVADLPIAALVCAVPVQVVD